MRSESFVQKVAERHHRHARRQGPAVDGSLQSGDLVGGRRIHLDPQFQGHRRRRALWQGLAAAADESRRAGSGHRRHRERPQRSDRDRMDVAARRHRSRAQRRSRACARSRATSCSGSPITRWCGRSSMSPSAIWARGRGPARRWCARGVFPGGSFRGQGQRDLSADQQGDANGARARRTAQSGPAADPRHVCRCRDRDRQRGSPCSPIPESAVIDSGSRQVVLVDKGEGRFEPREVKLGHRGEGYVEVREGLAEDEPVVDLGQLPDRRRKQSEGGAEGLCRAERSQ